MNVLLLSPGYPADMPGFCRGLTDCGARVYGVGEQPVAALPDRVRQSLSEYAQVRCLWDRPAVIAELHEQLKGHSIGRIECLWEPGIMLADELRAVLPRLREVVFGEIGARPRARTRSTR